MVTPFQEPAMIPSLAIAADVRSAALVPPAEFATLRRAVYFELLRLACRVLGQYVRPGSGQRGGPRR